jgi:hypothetical protein
LLLLLLLLLCLWLLLLLLLLLLLRAGYTTSKAVTRTCTSTNQWSAATGTCNKGAIGACHTVCHEPIAGGEGPFALVSIVVGVF